MIALHIGFTQHRLNVLAANTRMARESLELLIEQLQKMAIPKVSGNIYFPESLFRLAPKQLQVWENLPRNFLNSPLTACTRDRVLQTLQLYGSDSRSDALHA